MQTESPSAIAENPEEAKADRIATITEDSRNRGRAETKRTPRKNCVAGTAITWRDSETWGTKCDVASANPLQGTWATVQIRTHVLGAMPSDQNVSTQSIPGDVGDRHDGLGTMNISKHRRKL